MQYASIWLPPFFMNDMPSIVLCQQSLDCNYGIYPGLRVIQTLEYSISRINHYQLGVFFLIWTAEGLIR